MGTKLPKNFDGEKFAKKFGLKNDATVFFAKGGELFVPSMLNLTEGDLADCIATPEDIPISFDEFLDAFFSSEGGDKEKMKKLTEKYKKQKEGANG